MSTIAEIEAAIEKLPGPQVEELAQWLDTLRQRRATRQIAMTGCNAHAGLRDRGSPRPQ